MYYCVDCFDIQTVDIGIDSTLVEEERKKCSLQSGGSDAKNKSNMEEAVVFRHLFFTKTVRDFVSHGGSMIASLTTSTARVGYLAYGGSMCYVLCVMCYVLETNPLTFQVKVMLVQLMTRTRCWRVKYTMHVEQMKRIKCSFTLSPRDDKSYCWS